MPIEIKNLIMRTEVTPGSGAQGASGQAAGAESQDDDNCEQESQNGPGHDGKGAASQRQVQRSISQSIERRNER